MHNPTIKKKICSLIPDGYLTPRHTGRLTGGRNITLTLTFEFHEQGKAHNLAHKPALTKTRCMSWINFSKYSAVTKGAQWR
jgi:hypothetical protein